jgi:DNA-binding LacI/PurR family transcriptional regulator
MEKVFRELGWKKRWISKAILNHDFFIPEEETVRHLLEMGNNEIAFICERNEVKWVNKRSALALKAMFGVETEGKTRTAL